MHGELRFFPYAFPCLTLQKGLKVSVPHDKGNRTPLTVESVRPHTPFLFIRFQEVTSLEQARTLCNAEVAVEECRLPPVREGEFYYYQVVGLQVRTTTGETIGQISQVFFSGGHDVWIIRQGEKELLIPVTDEIVRSIDIASGQVVIEPMEGLLD